MAYLAREQGQNVYYEDYGTGDKAIVLIHGWGMGVRTWDYTLPALNAAGHRVVLIDHRGCGKSDKDFNDMSINSIAGDVCALVEELGLASVVLNGWSLGGAVAVAAADTLGDRCAGVALTCAATPLYLQRDDFPHGGTEEAMAGTVAGLDADRVNFLMGLSQGVCATEVGPVVEQWMWEIFMEASPLAVATIAELGPLDQRDTLAGLNVPIVSFVGAKDVVVDPEICRSVSRFNSMANVVEFEESGHAPFIDEAERYNNELLAFLGRC
ncbi:MAG: alpha/beta hydrolase [Pseudomonadota bacterium]